MAASVADAAAFNSNRIKKPLANDLRTFLINRKPANINGLWKQRNTSPWILVSLVVLFNNGIFYGIFYLIIF